MKKMGTEVTMMLLGMGAGMYLYSYSMKNPKIKMAMNKIKSTIKDFN
jgi:hypothetical protein